MYELVRSLGYTPEANVTMCVKCTQIIKLNQEKIREEKKTAGKTKYQSGQDA